MMVLDSLSVDRRRSSLLRANTVMDCPDSYCCFATNCLAGSCSEVGSRYGRIDIHSND